MAYLTKNGWLDELPSVYDIKCRGLFKIFEIAVVDPRNVPSYLNIEEKYKTFSQIRVRLDEMGISEWMVNNNVPTQFLQFAARFDPARVQYYITVLIDMPEELQPLFKLTFA